VEQSKHERLFNSHDALANNLYGGQANPSRSNKSPAKNSNGEVSNVSESESAQWKNVFPSYLQSREDESDGENDDLVQVLMLDWQLSCTCRLCSLAFSLQTVLIAN